VVRLNWLVLLISWVMRARATLSKRPTIAFISSERRYESRSVAAPSSSARAAFAWY
jgi:hypothetical protein